QDSIGLVLDGKLEKVLVEHLGTEILRLDPLITLKPVVSGKALHVNDRVDPDRMGIKARAGPDHHELATDARADELVDLRARAFLGVDLDDLDLGVIERKLRVAVDDEEGKTLGRLLHRGDLDLVKAHLL